MPSFPNVLIIKSDQHNARCLGVNGHAEVRTPQLDALAAGGVNFTRAFVQNPICSPSRMCYLTGQYVHNHGVFGLSELDHEPLPEALPSLFSTFHAAGFRTGIIGHIHVKESWLQPHCDEYHNLFPEETPGSDAYSRYLQAKGVGHLRDDDSYRELGQILDANPSELSYEDSNEGFCQRSFQEFLAATPKAQPFLYQLDCLHPHENYLPAQEFWEMYDGVELTFPPSAEEELADKPPLQRRTMEWVRTYEGVFEPRGYQHVRRRKLQGYYGCVSQVDHMVGQVLQALLQAGRAENTIVVYCSDHGDFALEHGFLEKAPGISYDAILRTPFIFNWPAGGFAGGTVAELVESVDLFPTLCALAGLEPPDTIDGVDISALLRGNRQPLRDFVVAEFPLSRTIRTQEWKLCHRPRGLFAEQDDAGELYSLADDPWEMTNRYLDPACHEIREELRRMLFDWTQLTTRYGCLWPPVPAGADGKATLSGLREMVKKGEMNYL